MQAARWLCRSILGRDLAETDRELHAKIDDETTCVIGLARHLLESDEYFDEQAGSNFGFFRRRIGEFFQCGALARTEAIFLHHADRAAFVATIFGDERVLDFLTWSIYDALGLPPASQLRDRLRDKPPAFFVEEVLSAAVQEEIYLRDAESGVSSVDLARDRLGRILSLFIQSADPWLRRDVEKLADDLIRHPTNYNVAAGEIAAFIRRTWRSRDGCDLLVGGQLAKEAATCPDRLFLTDLLAIARRDVPLSASAGLENEYINGAYPPANGIIRNWIDRFSTPQTFDEDFVQVWVQRLILSDGIIEVLAEFLLSDAGIGAIGRFIFPRREIANAPGPFIRSRSQSRDLTRIVATTFFYWYDNTEPDGRGFIACPQSHENEEGADSLTVSPETQDPFSFRSYQWHRSELRDMREANVNVVMPASYNYPFSWEVTAPDGPPDYLAFADAGPRVFRRAWFDLVDEEAHPPSVAMFYDTSTLHLSNRFGLQVDFRRRYAKEWFYESIRNFFSHIPREMWALYEECAIVFVYHPSFGLALDDSLYPYVRERFLTDFGLSVYIVTAAEEEAPRVINSELLVEDAKKLQSGQGLGVLADILACEHLYYAALSNDAAYAATITRRLFSRTDNARLTAHCIHGSLSDHHERLGFAKRLLASQEFAWRVIDRWFERLLRQPFDARDAGHRRIADEVTQLLMDDGDWLGALTAVASSDAFYAAAGGTDAYLVDWIYQSIVMKHPNGLCTPAYHQLWAAPEGKVALLSALGARPKPHAIREFLSRYEACEAIVSMWRYDYSGWHNPGPSDSSFYWSAAISPMIRGVASIGPGYDQSKCRQRPILVMPRQDGKTYEDAWAWLLAMDPPPTIVHIETWNEFFEGTPICRSKEFGSQYIELTRRLAGEFLTGTAQQI